MGLPHAGSAILDIRKLAQYCLDPRHARGRHKARVFREALGLWRPMQTGSDAYCSITYRRRVRSSSTLISTAVAGGLMSRCHDTAVRLW